MRRALILAALAGFAAALLTWTTPGRSTSSEAGSQRITAYLLDNGFHTDLVVPRAALMERGGPLAQAVAVVARRALSATPLDLPDGRRLLWLRPGDEATRQTAPGRWQIALHLSAWIQDA